MKEGTVQVHGKVQALGGRVMSEQVSWEFDVLFGLEE